MPIPPTEGGGVDVRAGELVIEQLSPKFQKEITRMREKAGVVLRIPKTIRRHGTDFALNDERFDRYKELIATSLEELLASRINTDWPNFTIKRQTALLESINNAAKRKASGLLIREIESGR